jgi:hypothetical protein
MKVLKFVFLTTAVMASQYAVAATETRTFDSSKIKSIEISNGAGEVTVGVSTGATTVVFEKIKFNEKCELSADVVRSVLEIKNKEKSGLGKDDCQVNVNVSGPKDVAIQVKNGSGNVKIRDTRGAIEYKLGSGDVDINAEITELHGKSGSGDLSAVGLSGNAHVDSGKGEIKLTFSKCPSQGKVDIRTGSGGAVISLPADSTVSTSFKAGSGYVKNDFGTSPYPKLHISMRAGSGSLNVKRQ